MDLITLADRLEGFIAEWDEREARPNRPQTYYRGRGQTMLKEFNTARERWKKCRKLKRRVVEILNEVKTGLRNASFPTHVSIPQF